MILVLSGGRQGCADAALETTRWLSGRQSWSPTLPVALIAAICGSVFAMPRPRQSLRRVPVPNAAPLVQGADWAGRYRKQTDAWSGSRAKVSEE